MGGLAYGDLYTSGAGVPCPLVVYIGGSISSEVYRQRLNTEPAAILAEFVAAAGNPPAADLLVVPFPPVSLVARPEGDAFPATDSDGVALLSPSSWQARLRRDFPRLLGDDLLGTGLASLHRIVGLVGFSSGAYIAAGLSLDLPAARSATFVGGTGMAEALRQGPPPRRGLRFLAIAGDEDPLAPNADLLGRTAARLGIGAEVRKCRARHAFDSYARCGAIKEAFGFVTEIPIKI